MQIRDIIQKDEPDTQIIFINKEQHEFSLVTDSGTLFDYINKNVSGKGRVALFIDEIQETMPICFPENLLHTLGADTLK